MDWVDALLALALGSACTGCDTPGRPWCAACTDRLAASVKPVWLDTDVPTVSCLPYADNVPEAIVAFKDRGVRALAGQLADILAAGLLVVGEQTGAVPVIVGVPSAPAAVRRRGFDHMAMLAAQAAGRLDLPCRKLLRSGRRADQAGLDFAQRRRNVDATVRVRSPGAGPVVVVDDVRTSGATLDECDRALRRGGYAPLAHVVIASAISGPDVREVAAKG
jgi:predicted amidophosphoribosyltransferase